MFVCLFATLLFIVDQLVDRAHFDVELGRVLALLLITSFRVAFVRRGLGRIFGSTFIAFAALFPAGCFLFFFVSLGHWQRANARQSMAFHTWLFLAVVVIASLRFVATFLILVVTIATSIRLAVVSRFLVSLSRTYSLASLDNRLRVTVTGDNLHWRVSADRHCRRLIGSLILVNEIQHGAIGKSVRSQVKQ